MIEMIVIAAIVSSVTLRVAGNVAVDGFFAARGQESPRYSRTKTRKPSGPASRYWSQVWEDSWNGALAKRQERQVRRTSGPDKRSDKPRGAATRYFSGIGQDARRSARNHWNSGWDSLDENRRHRATRVPPETQVVPGEVVPEPEGGTTPPAGTSTGPEPHVVPVPDGGTDPTDDPESDSTPDAWPFTSPTGPTMVTTDPENLGAPLTPVRGHDDPNGFRITEYLPTATPNERTSSMSTEVTEVTGLIPMINFCGNLVEMAQTAVSNIEQSQAAYASGGGMPPTELAQAMEHFNSAASALGAAVGELQKDMVVTEAFDARPAAPDKAFATGGR